MALQFFGGNVADLKYAIFCFTGKSPKPRSEMESIAIKAGASITKSIIDRTTILVIADANSNSIKARKARSLGIDLISPEQFFDMCNQVKGQTSSEKLTKVKIKITKQEPLTEHSVKKNRHSLVRRIKL